MLYSVSNYIIHISLFSGSILNVVDISISEDFYLKKLLSFAHLEMPSGLHLPKRATMQFAATLVPGHYSE